MRKAIRPALIVSLLFVLPFACQQTPSGDEVPRGETRVLVPEAPLSQPVQGIASTGDSEQALAEAGVDEIIQAPSGEPVPVSTPPANEVLAAKDGDAAMGEANAHTPTQAAGTDGAGTQPANAAASSTGNATGNAAGNGAANGTGTAAGAANAAPSGKQPQQAVETVSAKRLTPEQLKARVRAFADQYRAVVGDACDEIKRKRTDPILRQKAHQYKLDGATAMYDIAVEPSPQTALLDMLVLVTLQSYVANSNAEAEFPEDHPLIKSKTDQLKADAWRLAAQVMDEKQRLELMSIINRWWEANAVKKDVWYVRISDFAGYGKGTALEGVIDNVKGLPGKFLNAFVPLGDASDSLDEATAIGERTAWLAPRAMILAQWRGEALILETLATTEVQETLAAVNSATKTADRVATLAETLPDEITRQREGLFSDLSENEDTLSHLLTDTQATIESVQGVVQESNSIIDGSKELIETSDVALQSMQQIVVAVDGLAERLQAIQAEKLKAEEGKPQGPPFDIKEYTETVRALNEVLKETNTLVTNIDGSTQPTALETRVSAVRGEGEAFVDHLTEQILKIVLVAGGAIAGAGILIVLFAKLVPGRARPAA